MATTVEVSPRVLRWARETAGLSLAAAAAKLAIKAARGVAPVDRLIALESGAELPTRALLVQMSKQYRRPLVVFYLEEPPRRGERGSDFRTLPAGQGTPPEEDAWIDTLVRQVHVRQSMVRAVMEDEDEAEPVLLVGAMRGDVQRETSAAPNHAPTGAAIGRLAARATQLLEETLGPDATPANYHAQATVEGAFDLLRTQAGLAGVFVLLQGDLGSYRTAIDVERFRGFALADPIAPFVVINPNDARATWSFTLLHELTHLLIGETGVSGGRWDHWLEMLCNTVAAEWLLPEPMLQQLDVQSERDPARLRQRIGDFGRANNLSPTTVACRLYRAGHITHQAFEGIRVQQRKLWRAARQRSGAQKRRADGSPRHHSLRRYRLGTPLVDFAWRMMQSGALSATKAATILDVRPRHVGALVA